MAFLRPADAERVRQRLAAELEDDVDVLLFASPSSGLFVPGREESATGKQAEALLGEVAALSDRIHLRVVNPRTAPDEAAAYGVEMSPAIVIEKRRDGHDPEAAPAGRARMFGLPSGYEFMTLLDAISGASSSGSRLRADTIEALGRVTEPIHLQVFVTPT